MENSAIHFMNGKFVKEDELVIPVRDLGFLRGYAVFDFMITYQNQKPFMLKRHIDRLFNSLESINLKVPWSKEEIESFVLETLAKNKDGKEKGIKIIISGGVSDSLLVKNPPTIIILIDTRSSYPKEWYEDGVGITLVKHNRYNPKAKTNNYIEGVKQAGIASEINAIEPVYYDENQVYEGAISNIFIVSKGELLTPKNNVLSGITKEVLLEILKLDIPILEKDFTKEELLEADEVFLTGSNKEVTPVTRIDGNPVSDGKVGEITKLVMAQFEEFTNKGNW